ncbi:MAG TPA: hypothetical protein VLG28_11840 [Acidimicrobiia bacterium]|nr:hypothetical protein [Acidimicrobiia bacterium]
MLSINGIAQALGWIGLPILAGAALLALVVLSGGAEHIIDKIEDVQARRSVAPPSTIEHQEVGEC